MRNFIATLLLSQGKLDRKQHRVLRRTRFFFGCRLRGVEVKTRHAHDPLERVPMLRPR
jgi:hypothetical protein